MVKVKKSYAENRKLHPEVLAKYCSQASMAEPNDPVYLDTQSMFKIDGHFVGITVKPRVRIWCPLHTKQTIEGTVKDSKLLKRDGHYELHLTVSKEVEFHSNPSSILAIDLGERYRHCCALE
jgi:transposase